MRNNLMRKLRAEPWFDQVTAELRRLGVEYDFQSPTGKGHPKLAIHKRGKTVRMAVPCTGGGKTNYAYLVAEVRRLCSDPNPTER